MYRDQITEKPHAKKGTILAKQPACKPPPRLLMVVFPHAWLELGSGETACAAGMLGTAALAGAVTKET